MQDEGEHEQRDREGDRDLADQIAVENLEHLERELD